jgi:succinate dehydrogenase/fumarate reductase cytochrome b subunit
MLHTLHRVSACLIGAFIAIHLFNHLLALGGIDAHISFMESFRRIYRISVVEVLLLGCVLFQICSGIFFIKSRWGKRQGFYEKLQAISGGYLAFFLLNHVGAVLFSRTFFDLDTNFYFAAAGIHVTPFYYFFVPYYFLAVLAIFGHVACAFYWLSRKHLALQTRSRVGYAIISVGALTSLLIVLALSGVFYPVQIPAEYRATYGGV